MSVLKQFEDCYVRLEDHVLKIGNSLIERSWSIEGGIPINLSLTDKQHRKEWLQEENQGPMFDSPWLPSISNLNDVYLSSVVENDFGISEAFLAIRLDLHYNNRDQFVQLQVIVYPNRPFIRHHVKALPLRATSLTNKQEIEMKQQIAFTMSKSMQEESLQLDDNNKQDARNAADYIDRLPLRERHSRWETVTFRDQTDHNNNLISEDHGLLYVNERRKLRGNLLTLKNTLGDTGLLVIKEGATSAGHLNDTGVDFDFHGSTVRVIGSGVCGDDLIIGEPVTSYGATVGVYNGDRYEQYKLLQNYHRTMKRHRPEKDSYLLSNTWGDRSRDGRVTETFLMHELDAAARLGIDILQIDDGWQKGVTSNSVDAAKEGGRWGDYYSGGGDFWEVHPVRFPQGFTPIIKKAKELGIKLGLWYSPDSANHCEHWEKDRDTLLRMFKQWGVTVFKLDGVNLASKLAEERMLTMIRQVVEASGGAVDFNMDTTAQKRLGYWNNLQYGNIFLENRYTDWKSYYPHWTFRNLWMLSPYMPTSKLQMEFLNVSRNTDLYGDDPLAPAACGQVYAFAAAAFANPLAWMELSGLGDAQVEPLAAAIKAWKPHHDRIVAGHVLPIGDEPTGASWTGLQSITDSESGYLLVMRELHPSDECAVKLWGLDTAGKMMADGKAIGTESARTASVSVSGGTSFTAQALALRLTEILRMDEKDVVICGEESHSVNRISVSDSSVRLGDATENADDLLPPNANGTYSFRRPAPFTFAIYHYTIE